jgi:opacity protein-like surface antigen
MKRLAIIAFAAALAFVSALAAQTTDFSGTWTGTFNVTSPQPNEDVAYIQLKQKGKELTGTAGPSADRQWPLKGTVDGDKLTFEVQHDNMVLKFALTFAEGRLKGDASAEMDGNKLAAKVDVGRAK